MPLLNHLPSFLTPDRLQDCPAFYRFLKQVSIDSLPEFSGGHSGHKQNRDGFTKPLSEGTKPISPLVIHV